MRRAASTNKATTGDSYAPTDQAAHVARSLTVRVPIGPNSAQFFSTYRGMAALLHRFQHACHTTLGTVTLAFASRSSDGGAPSLLLR